METHQSSIYYVIPAQVFEDERLEPSELKFYALLSGLAHSSGYCFAGNDYLANRMRSNLKTIQRWLLKMEGLGYIKREVKKIGMKTDRKIFICHSKSNNSYEPSVSGDRDLTRGGRDLPHEVVETAPMPPIVSEVKLVSEKEKNPLPPSKGVAVRYGKFVSLTKEEFDSLREPCGGTEELSKIIEEINDYISSKGIKPYKDYAATIRNWLRRRTSGQGTSKMPQKSTIDKNMTLAKDTVEKMKGRHPNGQIEALHYALEINFHGNAPPVVLKYDDPNFERDLDHQLKKMRDRH